MDAYTPTELANIQYLKDITTLKEEIKTLKLTVSNYHEAQSYLMSESCVPNDTAFEAKVIELKNDNRNKDATIVRLTNENKEFKKEVQHQQEQRYLLSNNCAKLEDELEDLKEEQ